MRQLVGKNPSQVSFSWLLDHHCRPRRHLAVRKFGSSARQQQRSSFPTAIYDLITAHDKLLTAAAAFLELPAVSDCELLDLQKASQH